MMRFDHQHWLTIITIATLTLLSSSMVTAQTAPSGSIWAVEVELGAVFTSGNTDEQNIKLRGHGVREGEKMTHTVHLDTLNSSKDDIKSAQKAYVFYQGDFHLQTGSLFGRIAYEDDRFNGFDYQTDLTFGYSRPLYEAPEHSLEGDVGLGYRTSVLDNGDDINEAIVRLALNYAWKISENASFQQLLSTEIGDTSTISRSESSVSANIAGDLAMKFSINIKNNSEVPAGRKKTDTESSITLVYKF